MECIAVLSAPVLSSLAATAKGVIMVSSSRARIGFVLLLLALVLRGAARGDEGIAQLVGPFAKDAYPQRIIDRPLTLPAGMVEGEVGAQFLSTRFDREFLGVSGFDAWDGTVALRVGVTDRLQVEAGTSFSLDYAQRTFGFQGGGRIDIRPSPTSWRRVVPLRLSFLALDTEALDTALTVTLPFSSPVTRTINLGRGGRAILAEGDGQHALPLVELGAPTRWRLTDWLWLRAGENLFSVTTGSGAARFAFDFGVGVQPHRLFAVTFDARVAEIAFDGNGNEGSATIADASMISLTGIFTPIARFDLLGGFDLPNAGDGFDTYAIRTAVRVRF
jgi:hypothetical protein